MSPQSEPLPVPLLELVAERFKALSEPVRLLLLESLRRGERTVGQLASENELQSANVSKHLQLLYQANWVARRKEGLYVYYRLADDRVALLCDIMCGKLEEETEIRRKVLRG